MTDLTPDETPDEALAHGRPACPLCGRREYRRETGKIDSEWGMTAHKVGMLVCLHCGHVLLFYRGNTIFDFD